jgi:hypothetical protein
VMLRNFHVSQMASGALRPYWADACPASTQADTELPHWRVQVPRRRARSAAPVPPRATRRAARTPPPPHRAPL